jgi:hypothetical protein
MARNWWRVEYEVIFVNSTNLPGKVLFVLADNETSAKERVRTIEAEGSDGCPILTFDFQEATSLTLSQDERGDGSIGTGAIVYESKFWFFRGLAPTVAWSELVVYALIHEVPDISDDGDFDALFASLDLTSIGPIDEGSPVAWVRCFSGHNEISHKAKATIDQWQKAGADVQFRRAPGLAGAV